MTTPSGQLSRRQFIRLTAIAGLAAAAGGAGLQAIANRTHFVRVQETRMLLGSIANLTIMTPDPNHARQAITAAFDQMLSLESILSRFQPQSQLSQLNSSGYLAAAYPALREVLTKAVAYGDITAGAFDVTVEPVLHLYREASRSGQTPDEQILAAARQLVDYRQISIADNTIRLNKAGMAITLDGIAKGYIIDAGSAILSQYGFEHIMVELGGDLQTRGDAGERPWNVSIQQPTGGQSTLVAQLTGHALATSGDYQYTFTPDHRLHHILDPHSGVSPLELSSASVVAQTACDADALSTAVLVLGLDAGLALMDRLADAAALVITKQGTVHYSQHFPLRAAHL